MILPQQWLPELLSANKATLKQVEFLEGVVLGFELKASHLLGWHSTTYVTPQALQIFLSSCFLLNSKAHLCINWNACMPYFWGKPLV
jgi:hypothetical protein